MAESVRLEITVDDKGSPVIKAVSQNLDELTKKTASAAGGQLKLNEAATRGAAVLNDFGIQAGGFGSSLAGMISPIGILSATIGTGLAAAAVKSLEAFQGLAIQTRDLAFLSGGTAEQVSGLVDVLGDFGVESSTIERSLVFLSKAIQDGSPALDRLGISIRTGSGNLKTAHDLFYETIDALKNMTNETDRNAIGQELFSKNWIKMIPIVQQGASALREAAASSKLVLSAEDLRRAEDYRQALEDVRDEFELFMLTVGRGVIVPITFAMRTVREWVNPGERLTDEKEWRESIEQEMRALGAVMPAGPHSGRMPPAEGETAGEKRAREEREKAAAAEMKRSEYIVKQQLAGMDEIEKARTEFSQWTMKNLTEEEKKEAERTEYIVKQQLAGMDEIEKARVEFSQWQSERATADAKVAEEIQKQITEGDIKSLVARIDQQQALDDQAAKYEADRQQKMAQAREDAYRKSFLNIRGITEDAFAGMNSAVSTSIRGVIQGTQTMGDAWKRMGESIALGLVDSIVNRGLRAVQNALMDSVFGSENGGGGGINWAGLATSVVSTASSMAGGISAAASSVGSFLGFLDTGLWKVPGGSGKSSGSGSTSGGNWAVLHPGEMVVPPNIADMIRRAVALTGGSTFTGMAQLLTGGGGRGGTGPGSGAYGAMTEAQKSTLGSFGYGARGFGMLGGLLGMGSLGGAVMSGAISSILGFEGVRGVLGVDPSIGYISPTAADYQNMVDTYGVNSVQEAAARVEAAIGQSIVGDMTSSLNDVAAGIAAGETQFGGYGYGDPGYGEAPGMGGPGGPSGQTDSGQSTGEGSRDSAGGFYASGGLFRTRGRTRMTVGEAGGEEVAVLRNPRDVAMGGGSQITVHIDLRGSVVDNQVPTNIARAIKKSIDRIDSRRIAY